MYRRLIILIAAALFLHGPAWAQTYLTPHVPDKYVGDTSIYSGEVTSIKPNVLFMVDNSAGMAQAGSSEPYDPTRVYPNNGYATYTVYVRTAATGGTINYNSYITNTSSALTSVTCAAANTALQSAGYFAGKLKKQDGSCNATQEGNYYLGNLLNYMNSPSSVWQPNTAYIAGVVVKAAAADTYTWTCKTGGTSGDPAPAWPAPPDPLPTDFWTNPAYEAQRTVTESTGVKWELSSPLIALVTKTIGQVMPSVREKIKGGLIVFGSNNSGGAIKAPIQYINAGTGDANYTNLLSQIDALAAPGGLLNANQQSVNELLYDADWYFKGQNNSNEKISSDTVPYPNPIETYCQESFVVMITTGASHSSGQSVYTKIGDWNADSTIGYVEDSAKMLYDTDHLVDALTDPEAKKQRVKTIVIQLVTPRVPNLVQAAAYGAGESMTYADAQTKTEDELLAAGIFYYHVQTAEELIQVLSDTMLNVVLQAHTSFVAPTIPVSQQENLRSYSGNRVYMGFFRPISKQAAWHGNIKKYGIDPNTGDILDANNALATYVDMEAPFFVDDRDGATMAQDRVNGDFRPESKSFWTTLQCLDNVDGNAVVLTQTGDGGVVDCGGVGEKMLLRTAARNIYTYIPQSMLPAGYTASTILSTAVNRFEPLNNAITPRLLNYLSDAEAGTDATLARFVVSNPTNARTNLIKYMNGTDVWGQNPGNYVPAVTGRRMWVMGDVLHSKPVVVGYKTFDASQEVSCAANKSMIYIGSNDGMLHAFRDCDGEEEWAFIPTNNLGTVRRLLEQYHVNYVDSTIEKYVYDADRDGNIESGDKVFLIFGQRRGGGIYTGTGWGFYNILDVTDPVAPKMLGRFSNSNAGYEELGETWSEPKLGKMRIGTTDKIVLFIGAGYDNCNEDSRYGATMTYSGTCAAISSGDSGIVTSPSSIVGAPSNPTGRGVYAISLVDLDSSGNFSSAASLLTKIWGFTYAQDTKMKYSIPSELFLMDVNFDGYVDRLYAGDAGGTLWRFDVGDTSTTNWKATRVFASNPGTGGALDTGRKVFFKGDATIETDAVLVYFGTGDREHPLNRAVIDRVYAFFDKNDPDGTRYTAGPKTEADLVDVTEDQLQAAAAQSTVDDTLSSLQLKDGWFVRLDGMDYLDINGNPAPVANPGEKVLASVSLAPIVGEDGMVHSTLWVTTYRPLTSAITDPCIPGNLGLADALHFDYKTGEAVKNFDPFNDNRYNSLKWNTRAAPADGKALLRTDRRVHLGRGIPSGIVQCITAGGKLCLGVGSGGGYQALLSGEGSGIRPLYWRQR